MKYAFVFPGQGSQTVGMGQALADAFPVARQVFEEVDEALQQDLTHLIRQGPEEDLTLTENAQPALMAVSLAVLRVLEDQGGLDLATTCRLVAGHSLGEYSALAAADVFSVPVAARLLKRRGQAMQEAVPVGEGAMAALLGVDLETAIGVAEEAAGDGVCAAANDNAPGQIVVSGSADAVDRAITLASDRGAKRAIKLPVSAPFHCALMAPAAVIMAEALADVAMQSPTVPVVCNVTAKAVDDPETLRTLLVDQVTGMVRWRESVLHMKEKGVETVVELGAGKILGGLTRRIDRDLKGLSIGTPEDVEAFLASL